MNYQHRKLAGGRWTKFPLATQMANVGSEVFRMIKWRQQNTQDSRLAFERALELLDLTLADAKNKNRLKEIARLRELLVDYNDTNDYKTTDEFLENYFYAFNYAARLKI